MNQLQPLVMCSTPITIDNPNFGLSNRGISYLKNTLDSKIQVPCGRCQQCIALRQSFYLQRIQMESLRSHLFMLTLTYNDESLVHVDCGEYNFAIPVIDDVQKLFKRLRRKGHKFRYMICSEYGKRHFRPHFHAIIAVPFSGEHYTVVERRFYDLFFDSWARNISDDNWHPVYRKLFTPQYDRMRCTTFDFHYIEPVRGHDNDVSYYVSKYVTKYDRRTWALLQKVRLDPDLTDEQTHDLMFLLRPRLLMSKDFGDWKDPVISAKIREFASRKSDFIYPQFYDIYTGKQMPMSPYYGKRLVEFSHLYDRWEKYSVTKDLNSFNIFDDSTTDERRSQHQSDLEALQSFEKKIKKLHDRCEF